MIIQQNGKALDSLGEEQIALKNEINEYIEKIEAKVRFKFNLLLNIIVSSSLAKYLFCYNLRTKR